MKFQNEQTALGAALMQIAEDGRFSSINPLFVKGKKIPNGFLVNGDTALFLRYRSKGEQRNYRFQYTHENLQDIVKTPMEDFTRVILGMVCVEDREVCCVDLAELTEMMHFRDGPPIVDDDTPYTLTVKAEENRSFRVSGKEQGANFIAHDVVIPRNRFPDCVFSKR